MMRVVCVSLALLLSLLSAGQSAPLTSCENLTRPLENPGLDMMVGKWIFIAEGSEIPGNKALGKALLESATVDVTAISNNTLHVRQTQKMFGQCASFKFNMTFENNTFHIVHPLFQVSEVLLNTGCADCVLVHQKAILGGKTFSALQFLSKRKSVTPTELEEFKKQVECLKLPSPLIMDQEKDVCPDPSSSQDTENTDLTHLFDNGSGQDVKKLFDVIFNTEGGLTMLLDTITSGLLKLKEN